MGFVRNQWVGIVAGVALGMFVVPKVLARVGR